MTEAPRPSDCLFCKIVNDEIPADIVYRDDEIVAFRDINPQAPVHMLLIPSEHIATLNDLGSAHDGLIGRMLLMAQQLAAREGIAEDGYRLVFNCNRSAGQTVFHVHLHLIGGRRLAWPPG